MVSAKTSGVKRKAGGRAAAPYHHGALPEALLAAAERVLDRDGVKGLTLRAMAREAGVSHTAPQHHFGDVTGVLSALAATGFTRLRAMMLAKIAPDSSAPQRGLAIGRGYIAFAQAYPGLFQLMFRSESLNRDLPALREAATSAFTVLTQLLVDPEKLQRDGALSFATAAQIAGAWALSHGLSFLLIDGRLKGIVGLLGQKVDENQLVEAALASVRIGEPS
jgi:AcrR family transcriptional regulator